MSGGREIFVRRVAVAWCALPALICLLGSAGARSMEYSPAPAQAEWKLRQSALECRLSQPVPFFGEAVFRQGAGGAPQFELSSTQRIFSGDARLMLEAPPWRESAAPIQIASIPVRAGRVPVQLGESTADRILEGLLEGLSPVFERLPSNSRNGFSSVRLVAINFRAAYTDYRNCLSGLLPGSFADVSRLRVGYDAGSDALDGGARGRLDLLVTHLGMRKDVKTIYVDGYTDDTGRLRDDLELSRRRAQGVVDYLVGKGVPAEMLTMQYHGARFPVARGRSASARAQNRRVTVRVETR